MTGGELVVTGVFSVPSDESTFLDSYDPPDVEDDEVTLPKLDSASGYLFYCVLSVLYLTWYDDLFSLCFH